MSKHTFKELEKYKISGSLSDRALSRKLSVYPVYIYRWRKAQNIAGAYERIVENFLQKEKGNGKN